MIKTFRHIHNRRKILRQAIDVKKHFEDWQETCVPSYCHGNLAAAYVSWWRLFKSVHLARASLKGGGPDIHALDFGSSIGELGHLVPDFTYHFIEEEKIAVHQLKEALAGAIRHDLDSLPEGFFDVVFALDSLEHNDDYEDLLRQLLAALKPGGIMVLSGPTENALYRFGRKLAGFDGHYHKTNIYMIEESAARVMDIDRVGSLPPLMPLFRVSVWRKRPSESA